MSGNGLHIFSIMVTFYAIYNPIKSAFTVNTGDAAPAHRLSPSTPMPLRRSQLGTPSSAARGPTTAPRAPRPAAFLRFEDPKFTALDRTQLLTAKLTFVSLNFLAMSGAMYKMSLMGLLPNTASDWVGFLDVPPVRPRARACVIARSLPSPPTSSSDAAGLVLFVMQALQSSSGSAL